MSGRLVPYTTTGIESSKTLTVGVTADRPTNSEWVRPPASRQYQAHAGRLCHLRIAKGVGSQQVSLGDTPVREHPEDS